MHRIICLQLMTRRLMLPQADPAEIYSFRNSVRHDTQSDREYCEPVQKIETARMLMAHMLAHFLGMQHLQIDAAYALSPYHDVVAVRPKCLDRSSW